MTAKQIEIELRKIYPSIYCTGPIHCIALHGPNYNEWWIETNVVPGQHRHLAEERTEKKAWLSAWDNRDKYKEMGGIVEKVKEIYPGATWLYKKVADSTWKEEHTIATIDKERGKQDSLLIDSYKEEEFITGSANWFSTPDEAWMEAYKKLKIK